MKHARGDFSAYGGGAIATLISLKNCQQGAAGLTGGGFQYTFANMTQELATAVEPGIEYGPRMAALAPLQRNFVIQYLSHPTWTQKDIGLAAGYSQSSASIMGNRNAHDERVIAAIQEEGSRRLRSGGALAVSGLMLMVMNPSHKDHFRACVAVADRTGFHAMSEHKVTIDDKRPETHAELMAAVREAALALGVDASTFKKLTGEDAPATIEGEFTEIDPDVEADIALQMEDL